MPHKKARKACLERAWDPAGSPGTRTDRCSGPGSGFQSPAGHRCSRRGGAVPPHAAAQEAAAAAAQKAAAAVAQEAVAATHAAWEGQGADMTVPSRSSLTSSGTPDERSRHTAWQLSLAPKSAHSMLPSVCFPGLAGHRCSWLGEAVPVHTAAQEAAAAAAEHGALEGQGADMTVRSRSSLTR